MSTSAVGTGCHVQRCDHRHVEADVSSTSSPRWRNAPLVAVEVSLLPQSATGDGLGLWLIHEDQRQPAPRPVRVTQGVCAGFCQEPLAGFGRTRFGRSSAVAGDLRPEGGLWDTPRATRTRSLSRRRAEPSTPLQGVDRPIRGHKVSSWHPPIGARLGIPGCAKRTVARRCQPSQSCVRC